jgi:thioredoxin 1
MMLPLEEVKEEDFEARVLRSEVPVLLVFTADWCAPCKWLTPYLTEIASEVEDRARVLAVDTDRAPGLSRRYRIASLPTVVLLKAGEERDRSLGVEPERLRSWIGPLTTPGPGPRPTT